MVNELEQFKQLPPEPKLWEKKELEIDNTDYNKPLTVPLDKQMANLKDSLYWKPTEAEDNSEKNKEVKKQDLSTIEDSPYYPILKWLLEQGHLDLEMYNTTIEALSSTSNDEEQKKLLKKTVEGITSIDKKEKTVIIDWFNTSENVTEDNFEKTEFYTDFQNPETWAKPEGNDLDLLLAENYIKIPNLDWKEINNKNNLDVTINVVLNKIVKKQSVDFKDSNGELISDIRNSQNMWDKYLKLKKLLKESKSEDAKKWTNQSKAYNKKGKEAKENISSLDKKFNKIKEEVKISTENKDYDRLKELKEEWIEIKEETENSWEVFESWDIDKLLKEIEDTLKEQV
jgi:hypothetical protein